VKELQKLLLADQTNVGPLKFKSVGLEFHIKEAHAIEAIAKPMFMC
jgi:hypothetical protein